MSVAYDVFDHELPISKPDMVLFDWDDTLIDNWQRLLMSINQARLSMGDLPWSEQEAHEHIGPPAKQLFQSLYGDLWEEADRYFLDAYQAEEALQTLSKMPDAQNWLDFLYEQNIPMAIISCKRGHLLRQEVAHLGWDKYFFAITGAGDAPIDKPNPAAFDFTVKQWSGNLQNLTKHNIWYMGDSKTDLVLARESALYPILMQHKLPPNPIPKDMGNCASFATYGKIIQIWPYFL